MSTINSNQSETPQCSRVILIIYSQSKTEFLAARVSTKGLKQAQKVDYLHNAFERKDLETQEFHLNRKQWMFLTLVFVLRKQRHLIYSVKSATPHLGKGGADLPQITFHFSTSLLNYYVFGVSHVAQASLRWGDPSASAVLG